MRRQSPKTANRTRAADKWRDALCQRVARCECGCMLPTAWENLDVDEIARGSGHRLKALDQAYAVLCVRRLHHQKIQNWPRAKRLALLYIHRPSDFDLIAFWALTQRKWPDWDEVSAHVDELLRLSFAPNL